MRIPMSKFFALAIFAAMSIPLHSQQPQAKPEDTEIWQPEPKVVTPAAECSKPPSDAIVLFDGKNLEEWVSANDRSQPAKWTVADGILQKALKLMSPENILRSLESGRMKDQGSLMTDAQKRSVAPPWDIPRRWRNRVAGVKRSVMKDAITK